MERPAMNPTAAWAADNDRNSGSPAIPAFGGEIGDLIEGAGNEIRELHFCDRAHSHQCRADCGADDSGFRDRRVDDPPFAEAFEHSRSDLECSTVNPNV